MKEKMNLIHLLMLNSRSNFWLFVDTHVVYPFHVGSGRHHISIFVKVYACTCINVS
jgi:hypothetical protein